MAQAKDTSGDAADTPEEIVVEADEIIVEEAPSGEAPTATATLTDEKPSSPLAGERVIYVASPESPKPRSNRIVGSLLALVGSVIFVLLYGLVGAGFIALVQPGITFGEFITDAVFWIPVLFFTIGFLLVVALVNRAPWWVHVAASLLVGVITYFGSVGMLLLVTSIAGQNIGFVDTVVNPFVIAATILAREVSIWVGLLISRRGAKLTARNKEDLEAFEAQQAERTADGASTPPA